jgi:hypothetical protein
MVMIPPWPSRRPDGTAIRAEEPGHELCAGTTDPFGIKAFILPTERGFNYGSNGDRRLRGQVPGGGHTRGYHGQASLGSHEVRACVRTSHTREE